ncbi:MAG: BMC domain-containing protein [bacterium]|nr:BMC domain-containing protein [bacterium]
MNTTDALALLEYDSLALGIAAVDRMLKASPIALLKCGSVHPGRWLALIGGTVASVEAAYAAGVEETDDAVLLRDPHPALRAALAGRPAGLRPDFALGALETGSAATLLKAVDTALKAAPVGLAELRLCDDLGGRGLALLHGELADVQAALAAGCEMAAPAGRLSGRTLTPRLDAHFCGVLNAGTSFRDCVAAEPAGAEYPEGR